MLLIDPLDSGSGAAIEANAEVEGRRGRSTTTASRSTATASYYVSFDNVKVGKLIGQGLVDCISAWKVAKPQVLVMDGDPTDNNAKLFAQGYNGVLKPKFESGAYVKVGEPAGTWTPRRRSPPSSSSSPRTRTSTRSSRRTTATPTR